MSYTKVKRLCDLLCATIAIVLLSPVLFLVAAGIKLDSKGPIFYRQERVGRFGEPFMIWKFRTMHTNAPMRSTEEFTDCGNYITKYGHFLRKFGLDELAQFINVFKGDMSLVGPRPVILAEGKLTRLRMKNGSLAVRPGMTGWAQVNGRDDMTLKKKAEYDGYYAQNMSPFFDIAILFLTVITIITHKGYKEGEKIIEKKSRLNLSLRINLKIRSTINKKANLRKQKESEKKNMNTKSAS